MKTKVALGTLVAIIVIGALLLLNSNTRPAADPSPTPEEVRLSTMPSVAQPKNPTITTAMTLPPPLTSNPSSPSPAKVPPAMTQEASPTTNAPQQPSSTPELNTPQPGPTATSVTPAAPTPQLTEGIVGEPPTPAGRLAPDAAATPLQIQQIRIFPNTATGTFSGRANLTNTGPQFLNGLIVSWQILDGANQVLDHGQFSWPNLAPGETATVSFDGSATFVDSWVRVNFEFTP